MKVIGYRVQMHLGTKGYYPTWYVADLPGCDGTKRNKTLPNSDWGWTTDMAKAIHLTPYWQRRFLRYLLNVSGVGDLKFIEEADNAGA